MIYSCAKVKLFIIKDLSPIFAQIAQKQPF